ncbi:MAG TPA: SpoIIE family protein phosphatase [Candidatus Krumholzibacteria bacterium]|nr:SpoIIE family protein phosphatase [Candidatus Krumholzibacteria bacterium]
MPIKILVVDDEPDLEQLVRQKFRRAIRDNEFAFAFARSGRDAMDQLRASGDVDVVLTDINMPEMDGLTLLGEIEGLQAESLKAVVVSAYGDMDNIRVAMNRGAFDFVTKPINLDDLELTIQKALKEVSAIKVALHTRDKLIAIEKELNVAAEIQMSMLPTEFPPFPDRTEFDVFARMVPAREVGGDLYDFFLVDEHRVGFLVGDVSGKGTPAALLMAISRTLLRGSGHEGLSADAVIAEANRILAVDTLPHMFVTVFYAILDTRTGVMEFCNAGHNNPNIVSADGVRPLEAGGGLPVGVMEDYPYTRGEVTLRPGDTVFIYSDGVTEAFDAEGNEFEEERLEAVLRDKAGASLEGIVGGVIEAVQAFATGVEQSDDITCLALRYTGV